MTASIRSTSLDVGDEFICTNIFKIRLDCKGRCRCEESVEKRKKDKIKEQIV
jgi:hypothetical protein